MFLGAGHRVIDLGAVGTTTEGRAISEAAEMLPVELDTANLLRSGGFRVVGSRTADSSVVRLTNDDVIDGELSLIGAHGDVAARDVCASLAHASVLLGVDFDSGATPTDARSLTTYDTVRPFAGATYRLAMRV